MPILFPKRFEGELSKIKARTIFTGERSFVQEFLESSLGHPALAGKIGRFALLSPRRRQEPEKALYYKNKIARLLFPDNFVDMLEARNKDPANTEIGGIAVSNKIEMDSASKKAMALFENCDYTLDTMKKIYGTALWRAHERRVERKARDIARRIADSGIFVNPKPINVWFDVNGNPVFFDIIEIFPDRLLNIRNLQNRQQITAYLKRLDAALKSETPSNH